MKLLVLGLANWIATLIVVDSEVFRPVREAVFHQYERSLFKHQDRVSMAARFWRKVAYLVDCYLCTGTWLALGSSAFVSPLAAAGFVGWLITGLAVKGVGHTIIEVTAVLKKWSK